MNKLQSLETFAPFVSLLGVVRTIVQHLSGFRFFCVLSFLSLLLGFHDDAPNIEIGRRGAGGTKESRYQRISKLYLSFVEG